MTRISSSIRMLSTTKRILALVVALCAVGVGVAQAYWTAESGSGGTGASQAGTVAKGAAPTATPQSGRKVLVNWGATTLSNGGAVDGYIVKRYNASNSSQTVLSGCSGTITSGTSCTESNVPAGAWTYTVTPVFSGWRGAESDKSGTATVGSATLTLSKTYYGASDFSGGNATVAGTLSGFADGEGIAYKLDDASTGTSLTGTPTSADSSGGANVSLTLPQPSDGAHTIYTVGDAGSPSQASAGIVVDTVAPVPSADVSPAPNAAGWNNTSPVSVSLSATDTSGSGVQSIRYTTDGSDPKTSGTAATYSSPISLSASATVKYYATDVAGNASSVQSQQVRIDTTAPTGTSATPSAATGNTFISGSTVFINAQSGKSGGFTVASTPADGDSGIAKVSFPALAGFTSGGGDDATSPYSTTYAWSGAAATAGGSQTVTAYNNADLFSTASFTVTADTTAPSVSTPTVPSGYSALPIAVGTTAADDGSGSGVATSGVERLQGALSGNSCDYAGATWSAVTLSSGNDTSATTAHCYEYRQVATDRVGNSAQSAASSDVKVDTSAPSFTGFTVGSIVGSSTYASGSTVYYNPHGSNSGSFTLTPTVSDPQSGVQKVNYPDLTAGGFTGGEGDKSTSPFASTYSWTSTSSATGAKTATVTSNAGGTATQSFTLTQDTTAPTVNTPANPSAYYRTLSVPVSATAASDAGSGLKSSGFERLQGNLSNDACDYSSASWAPVTLSSGNDATVTSGHCYQYRQVATDNVGNSSQSAATSDAKVDTSAPSGSITSPTGGTSTGGTFAVTSGDAADGGSGVSSVQFQVKPTAGSFSNVGSAVSAPGPYTTNWDSTAVANGAYVLQAIITDKAGNQTTTAPVNVTITNGFVVTAPSTATAGTPISVTIQATKGTGASLANNTDYTGSHTLSFTGPSNSPSGATPTYPATVSFTAGAGSASVTLVKAESPTLTVTSGNLSGASNAVSVTPGSAARLAWTTPSASAGTLSNPCVFTCSVTTMGNNKTFSAKVSVTDANGNIVSGIGTGFNVTVAAPGAGGINNATLAIPGTGAATSSTATTVTTPTGSWTVVNVTASGGSYTATGQTATAALNK